jgi:hypothetical protein
VVAVVVVDTRLQRLGVHNIPVVAAVDPNPCDPHASKSYLFVRSYVCMRMEMSHASAFFVCTFVLVVRYDDRFRIERSSLPRSIARTHTHTHTNSSR